MFFDTEDLTGARMNRFIKFLSRRSLIVVLMMLCFSEVTYAKGFLQINSAPPNIQWKVDIDGKQYNYNPGVEILLEDGPHEFFATAEGYQPIDNSFTIRNGEVLQVTLTATSPQLVETTRQQTFSTRQKTARLVVVSRPENVNFSVNDHKSKTPASFTLAVGAHTMISGTISKQFNVVESKVTYLQIDSVDNALKSFRMTKDQEMEIQSTVTSQTEIFDKGFRLYGENIPWWQHEYRKIYAQVTALVINNMRYKIEYVALGLIGCLMIFTIYFRFRYSLNGRAKAVVRKKRKLEKKISKLGPEVPLKEKQDLEKKVEKQVLVVEKFVSRLNKKIEKIKRKEEQLHVGPESMKKQKKLQALKNKVNGALGVLIEALDTPTSEGAE